MNGRLTRVAVAIVVMSLLAAGCAPRPAPKIARGSSVQTVTVDDEEREFRVFRPAKLRKATPLVIVMHGWGFTAEQTERDYGWNDVAKEHGFVVVHPQGLGLSWNAAGECCGPAAERDVDDMAFIKAMVEHLSDTLPIDGKRIYAAGMSNGGVFAYELACRTSIFAAIGAVAATQVGTCADPRPTSVMHIHGVADSLVRMDGAPAVVPGARPVAEVMADWYRIGSCRTPSKSRAGSVVTTRAKCAHGTDVTLVLVDDEGHTWPGRPPSTSSWDATTAMWEWFSGHSLPEGGN